jgi:hypothetical protein
MRSAAAPADFWPVRTGVIARVSHTLAAYLANHLAASGFVLPDHITRICHPLATKTLRNLNHPSVG